MSVSLIGIILIQSFFIFKNYEENDKQFSINVNYVLEETASIVERNEFRKYVRKFRELIANEALVDVVGLLQRLALALGLLSHLAPGQVHEVDLAMSGDVHSLQHNCHDSSTYG